MHLTAALLAGLLVAGTPTAAVAEHRDGERGGHHVACASLPLIAHRGVHSKHVTEDTTASFAAAVALRAHTVEGDARISASGTWVLMHDAKVNRTTHARGRVAELTDAQLAAIAYDDGRVGVSTLDDAVATMTDSPSTRLQIEIKPPSVDPATLQQFLDILEARGLRGRTVVASYHRNVIAALHALDPSWPTTLVTKRAPRRPAELVPYGTQIDLQQQVTSARAVRRLHNVGIRVQSWTVDSYSDLRRVVRAHPDAVLTDRLVKTRAWCRQAPGSV